MKKVFIILALIAVFFITYFLQSDVFNFFTIGSIKPNLFVILVLFIGLFAGRKLGIILGVLFGLFLDLIFGKTIGISAVMLGIIGFLGGFLDKNFSKESRITIMLMVIGCTCIFEIGSYSYKILMQDGLVEILTFLKMLAIEVVYNSILTIILYPLLQKAGYYTEDEFKGKKILTRYF